MKQALILVDIQNDYFTGGTMELSEMDAAAKNCARLLQAFRQKKAPIFHIQHLATHEGATFFIPNTFGCEIREPVKPEADETLVIKHFPSAFRDTDLDQMLKLAGIEEVTICGAMTHMCIDTTTRAAFDLGYRCRLVADACATRELEFNGHWVKAAEVQVAFMAALSAPFAQVSTTDEYLNA